VEEHRITGGGITIACDSLLALQIAQASQIMDPNKTHYDLISAIQHLKQLLPLHLMCKHVKGHQDYGQITVLPCKAWMNIEMDAMVKQKVTVDGLKHQSANAFWRFWVCLVEGQ